MQLEKYHYISVWFWGTISYVQDSFLFLYSKNLSWLCSDNRAYEAPWTKPRSATYMESTLSTILSLCLQVHVFKTTYPYPENNRIMQVSPSLRDYSSLSLDYK